jgi:hypothetical protein
MYGPASPEYNIKRMIVAVCRRWWDVGIELLYKEVVIRRADCLAFLLRTLVAPGSRVGRLITRMVISCIVPFEDDLIVFEESMKHVIANCPSLSNLVFDPSFPPLSQLTTDRIFRSLQIGDGTFNITHLDWGYSLLIGDLVRLLQHCPSLESLQFHLHDRHSDVQKVIGTTVLLPHLQELQLLRYDATNNAIEHFESKFAARWSMPQLQKFTYNNNGPSAFADITGFCQIHGSSLRCLHLGPDWREWIGTDTLQGILNQCPALEHLVLWVSGNLRTVSSLGHPKIVWIDAWVDLCRTRELETFLHTKPQGLPSLNRVRVFDNRLWRPFAINLPYLLPPANAILEDGLEYDYIDYNIKQEGNLVYRTDLTWSLFDGEGCTSDEGSDFDGDTDGDASDGDSTSADDDSSSSEEEGNTYESDVEEETPATDPELALASFLSILES